ncbi:putative thioredoxin reductase NTRA-like [Cocos nucifera]|uniref:Putative thioredoxin reductase NTRA-like n=1 Tax=Cocos nucifera TaxID=13894 RepID=A0A8K0ISE0_COCNU|nr:putative thioredoxin reductase NTRA-like [Cocos nucifera]
MHDSITASKALRTHLCVIHSGPITHTTMIYAAYAALLINFEGWMADNVAGSCQLTTTTHLEISSASWRASWLSSS